MAVRVDRRNSSGEEARPGVVRENLEREPARLAEPKRLGNGEGAVHELLIRRNQRNRHLSGRKSPQSEHRLERRHAPSRDEHVLT